MEYDPSTGSWRAIERYSSPLNLLWTLFIALALFGFQVHSLWFGAGALAAVLLFVEGASRRRSHRRSAHPR